MPTGSVLRELWEMGEGTGLRPSGEGDTELIGGASGGHSPALGDTSGQAQT